MISLVSSRGRERTLGLREGNLVIEVEGVAWLFSATEGAQFNEGACLGDLRKLLDLLFVSVLRHVKLLVTSLRLGTKDDACAIAVELHGELLIALLPFYDLGLGHETASPPALHIARLAFLTLWRANLELHIVPVSGPLDKHMQLLGAHHDRFRIIHIDAAGVAL